MIEASGRPRLLKPLRDRRVLAVLTLMVLLAVSAGALMRLGGRDQSFPATPFPLTQLSRDVRLRVAAPHRVARHRVVLYASEHCPHCHAELARWMRVVSSTPSVRRSVAVIVLTPPAPPSVVFERTLRRVPHARVVDSAGVLARQLLVRTVPTTFYVDASDTVRGVTVGQTSDLIIRRQLANLKGQIDAELD